MLDIPNCDVIYYVIYIICSHYVRKAITPFSLGPAHICMEHLLFKGSKYLYVSAEHESPGHNKVQNDLDLLSNRDNLYTDVNQCAKFKSMELSVL